MAKGVLYKFNASTWSKSQSKKMNASTVSDGKVRHANATTWYDNYPMEQVYTQTFNIAWTQGYNGSGVKLDYATWGNHPRSGGSANFQGLFGFDNTAMKNFVANGVIQSIKLTVMFDDPLHAGNPTVNFCPHDYKSVPASWDGWHLNKNYVTTSQFVQTGYDFARTISMPIGAWLNGGMGGIAIYGTTAAADSCRFAGTTTYDGLSAYTSKLEIKVLK